VRQDCLYLSSFKKKLSNGMMLRFFDDVFLMLRFFDDVFLMLLSRRRCTLVSVPLLKDLVTEFCTHGQ
jgi:hypothetical protein